MEQPIEADDEVDSNSEQRLPFLCMSRRFQSYIHPVSDSDSEFSAHIIINYLSLPCYDYGDQMVQNPIVVETSKWIKLVFGKACKAFRCNTIGFEYEIMGMIVRMKEMRQLQHQTKKGELVDGEKNKKRKGRMKLKGYCV